MDDEERDNKLEEIALKYQDLITDYYSEMSVNVFNVPIHRFEMKTECIIRSAYFRATRRYAQWITKKEGVVKNELDIKGLEFMKANFPPIFGKFFNKILELVLKGTKQSEIDKMLLDFREQIMSKDLDITILGNPTSVKTLNDYVERLPRPGEMFSLIKSKAPAPVKAAIKYNDLLTFWGLDKQHSRITQGDKVKWIYLRDNPYKIEALAFLDFDMPEKIRILLDDYADKHKSFESILESKLEGFYHDLGWSLNLNPYRNMFFSF
jgi:DNA polymerase elongation subunit (family B)